MVCLSVNIPPPLPPPPQLHLSSPNCFFLLNFLTHVHPSVILRQPPPALVTVTFRPFCVSRLCFPAEAAAIIRLNVFLDDPFIVSVAVPGSSSLNVKSCCFCCHLWQKVTSLSVLEAVWRWFSSVFWHFKILHNSDLKNSCTFHLRADEIKRKIQTYKLSFIPLVVSLLPLSHNSSLFLLLLITSRLPLLLPLLRFLSPPLPSCP